MRATSRSAAAVALALSALLGDAAPGTVRVLAAARAEAGWRAEFDEVCGRTQDAMAMTDPELRDLVQRCDKLMPLVEQLPGPEKNVYARRLRKCRDLYQFVLDGRAKESG
jgi:hypothetical protein